MEALIWRLASSHYAQALTPMLQQALACFRRRPGLDHTSRLSPAALSDSGFQLLGAALSLQSRHVWHVHRGDHIELRWQLRMHLMRYLQEHLIRDEIAPGAVRDDRFAGDLGL
jgi:hypothetical protein